MTEAQAVEAVYQAWKAGWEPLHASIPYFLGNEAGTAPDRWARVTVVPSIRGQGSMGGVGSRRFENRGRIAVQLFTPVDAGDAELRGLCDDARTVLECASLAGSGEAVVTFGAVTASITTDGRWYMAVMTVPFLFWSQR